MIHGLYPATVDGVVGGAGTYHYRGRRAGVALGVVCAPVALVGLAIFAAEGVGTPGLVGLAIAAGAVAAWWLTVRRVRAGGVRIAPGRLGRLGGAGSTTWCDLDAAALATVQRYGVVLGGRQTNLVVWTSGGGDRRLVARFARAGTTKEQHRDLTAAASRVGTDLAPFVVQLDDLPDGAAEAILEHVCHLR